jgi:hypothetical protein
VDIHRKPKVIRYWWSHAVGDVVEGHVHGEEERDDLPPLGVVLVGGGDLELDVADDVDTENWVGRWEGCEHQRLGGEEVVGGIGAVEYWRWPWSATRSLEETSNKIIIFSLQKNHVYVRIATRQSDGKDGVPVDHHLNRPT